MFPRLPAGDIRGSWTSSLRRSTGRIQSRGDRIPGTKVSLMRSLTGANLEARTSQMKPTNIAQHSAIQKISRFLHLDIPEVWVRFLLAIVGLILAFGAALFSTVSRESGNLWATVLLASTALVLAVVVGLTTVPYLARRVAGAGIRDAFDFDVTKIGIVYVAIVLLIGIAALNTGNNLLYIVVAAMLAAILVSGIMSALVLRRLELDIRLPEHVFAGRPMVGRFVLRNPRRFLPALSIRVVPLRDKKKTRKQWRWERTIFA